MQVRRRALHEQKSQSKYFGSVLLDINDTKYETASIQQVARYNKNSAKGGFIVSSPFFIAYFLAALMSTNCMTKLWSVLEQH
ncbi:hypothetical protein RP300_00588 [Oligella urethralis]|nr:hypothetical protein RP300_00588 [Oligella urethralis]